MKAKPETQELVDHFFRHEYARMVAVLTRYFGLDHIEIAEDIVQDTLTEALECWGSSNLPNNPAAWLMDVAKKKTINFLKRHQLFEQKIVGNFRKAQQGDHQDILEFKDEIIEDSMLRMIFCCCHPTLQSEGQIVLALKSLCGLSSKEIAFALLSNTETVNKRLFRAKDKFRQGIIAFEIPDKTNLESRLENVLLVLYLLFNEGYHSSHPDKLIRADLCTEAIRLNKLLLKHFPERSEIQALMALMLLQFARVESRLDDQGAIIILQDQDRTLWDKTLITLGIEHLHRAMTNNQITAYHLKAGIAAEHCLAESSESTNWHSICKQYALLKKIEVSPIIELNSAIANFFSGKHSEAFIQLEHLEKQNALRDYPLLYATLGEFHLRLGHKTMAKSYFSRAIEKSQSNINLNLLQKKLESCE
ncbi:sigma-70 family RNA polymerase sigma factor [Fulvivirgaceae bacterium BMA10]|uniref:Sigma-70 family RNA polymerase sigma factor n=1 Tax=Splendidivirga corallicola TaxID=3051826 RepID=A0ABT8KS76_9BACT|nr:sigma-70 family RNA polymerase sigma factor [Fulvivirgaceae bacterium BMA10]